MQDLNMLGLVTVTVSVTCPMISRQGQVLNKAHIHPEDKSRITENRVRDRRFLSTLI